MMLGDRSSLPGAASVAAVALLVLDPAALPLAAYEGAPVTEGGRISGRITFAGAVPAASAIPVTRDQAACGTSVPDERLVVGGDGGLLNAVVVLEGIARGKPAAAAAAASLERRDCVYRPHVQALVVNQVLEVKNLDPLPETTRALLNGEDAVFSLSLPIQNQVIRHKLKTPGLLHLQSDQADWMSGYLFVFEHPYAVVTGRDGAFRLDDVPPGTYELRVWHERLGTRRSEVRLPPGGEVTVNLPFEGR